MNNKKQYICPICNNKLDNSLYDFCYPVNNSYNLYISYCGGNSGCGRTIYGYTAMDSINRFTDVNNKDESKLTEKEAYNMLLKIKLLKKIHINIKHFY